MTLRSVSHFARGSLFVLLGGLATGGCTATPSPVGPGEPSQPAVVQDEPPLAADTPTPAPKGEANNEEATDDAAPAEDAAPAPEFRPGMSVDEARRAVPQGASRANLDDDFLGAPLQEPGRFDRCGFTAQEHFTVTVAVWDGSPVGIDVVTKSAGKAACVREIVEGLRWRSPTKALNTITFTL